MPKRDTDVAGAPCWIDLMTSDQSGARRFYGELFGWESNEPQEEFGGYLNFTKNGEMVAGCMPTMQEGAPDVWSVYLNVSDAEAASKEVESHGGHVIAAPMAVSDLGTMAVYSDPSGAAFGTWQPGTHLGIGVVDEPGTPSWFELMTKDYDQAVPFYREALGWQTTVMGDTADFRYTVEGGPDNQYAGIMDASGFLPEGVPSFWQVYIQVEDVDATAARAAQLGGTIVEQPEDTPYGRLAGINDPTGAHIRLRGPNVQPDQA